MDEINKAEQLFNQYSNLLFKLAMMHLGNKTEAQDAVQEVFVRYIAKQPAFNDSEHEKAWFIRVTINICKDTLKSSRNKTVPLEQIQKIMEEYVLQKDTDILHTVLNLPQKYKSVIFLYYYNEYTVIEIAETLHLSAGNVKMRLSRARKLLKIDLEKDYTYDKE
jgi:RNA polymerase sigma-70 factor (ECF subfamily)